MLKTKLPPKAKRLEELKLAVFSEMDEVSRQLKKEKRDVINLSVGSPDLSPPSVVKKALAETSLDDKLYGYALTHGMDEFRTAIVDWYSWRFNVKLDSEKEVLPLLGSQDGIAHIFLAYIDPGDIALIPEPGYTVYTASLLLAGGEKYPLKLLPENNFLPDLSSIPSVIANKAKIMVLNYPSNPVATIANLNFFQEVVEFAHRYNIFVCHDAVYSELTFDGYRSPSFLEVEGAKEVGVEFHSVSKSFNMAGCRVGFVVGNEEAISNLECIKSNIDFGIFKPLQIAASVALSQARDWPQKMSAIYQQRRDLFIEEMKKAGWIIPKSQGSMFLWAKIPASYGSNDSVKFAKELALKTGVIVCPGKGFGSSAEGYVRLALVVDEKRLVEAAKRINERFPLD